MSIRFFNRNRWAAVLCMGGLVALQPLMPMARATGPEEAAIAPSATPIASPDLPATLAQRIFDPADQAAPAGLPVRPGEEPISPFMGRMMLQELENLVGRFETALLLANTADVPSQLQASDPSLTASLSGVGLSKQNVTDQYPALDEAQQLIRDWQTLLNNRDYGTARQRWLAARQNLWNNFPVDRPTAQPEIRAMWLDRGTIVRAGSPQGLANIFERLAAAGINTVFVETLNAGYPIYPSRVAPQQNPLTRHWDPLAAAVDLGQTHGIEVHAWAWIFATGNQMHNTVLNLPFDYLGPLLNAHPGWAGADQQGNVIPVGQTKPFLDPANPQVRNYLMRLLEEIATNYDVDGIQFDYIRYPFQDPAANRTYGYGLAARQQFQRMTGVDPLTLSPRDNPTVPAFDRQRQRHLWDQWTEFRIQQVNTFVAEASRMLRRQRPDLTISAAVFAKPTHERLQKIQQDWETWARNGDVDWIVLMSYALDTNRFEELIRPWVVENNYGSTLIIPGIRLLNLPEMAAFDQIQTLRDLPTSGYALFAADNLEQGIQTILNATQGTVASTHPIPQQEPFTVAALRYQTLQREWGWLLDNQQLALSESRLNQWTAEVDLLGENLAALANDPSRRRIGQVRNQLQRLKTNLDTTVSVRTASSAYRLRAWQHRLTAIEHLLAYGEARL